MQVIYSGGSTPTPSPRVKRKQFKSYGRPCIPGYAHSGGGTPPLHSRGHSKERLANEKGTKGDTDSSLRDSIPAMRQSVAITCLVLNILLPGLGTFVCGLTVLCGSVIRFKDMGKQKVICSNTWVAFLQFVTAFLFLLGWIWSIVWGAAFITISNDYFKKFKRPNMPLKLRRNDSDAHSTKDHTLTPDSKSNGINRTRSSPGISSAHHSILRSSSADQPTHPLIVQQRAPLNSHSESSLLSPQIVVSDSKSKCKRPLRRQFSDKDEYSRELTSQERLEQIVIHNLPRAPLRRGILRRDDTITSTTSTVSEEDTSQSYDQN